MIATTIINTNYAAIIKLQLGLALAPFGWSIDTVRFIYDAQRDTHRCDALLNTPWGETTQVGAELWASTVAENKTHDVIKWYVFSMAKHVLIEADVKEEVAEGRLPPEVLDTLAEIHHVIDTLVIQQLV